MRTSSLLFLALLLASPRQPALAEQHFAVEQRQLANGVYGFFETTLHAVVSGNIVAVIGDEAILVFDAGHHPQVTREVIAQLRSLSPKPVKYLVISHWHDDHWVGAAEFADAYPGLQVIAHPFTAQTMATRATKIIGAPCRDDLEPGLANMRQQLDSGRGVDGQPITEARRMRLVGFIGDAEAALAECPAKRYRDVDRTVEQTETLPLGGRSVELRFLGRANTAGDLVAIIPDARMILTGDIVVHPFPFATASYISEWGQVLRRIESMAPTTIVPGHGAAHSDLSYARLLASLFESIDEQARTAWKRDMSADELRTIVDVASFRRQIAGDDPFIGANFDYMIGQLAIERMWQQLAGTMKPENGSE